MRITPCPPNAAIGSFRSSFLEKNLEIPFYEHRPCAGTHLGTKAGRRCTRLKLCRRTLRTHFGPALRRDSFRTVSRGGRVTAPHGAPRFAGGSLNADPGGGSRGAFPPPLSRALLSDPHPCTPKHP